MHHHKPHAALHSLLIDAIRNALSWNMHAALRHKTESLVSTWEPKWLEFRYCNGKELALKTAPLPIIPHSSVKKKGEHIWIDSSLTDVLFDWIKLEAIHRMCCADERSLQLSELMPVWFIILLYHIIMWHYYLSVFLLCGRRLLWCLVSKSMANQHARQIAS